MSLSFFRFRSRCAVQDTGGLADIVAQLCRKLSPSDELAEFRKITYVEECKAALKNLCYREGILTPRDDEIKHEDLSVEIEKYVGVLDEMESLIVVFDALEHRDNLENAIATAMLNAIRYRVANYEQFFSSETRAAELAWCLVRLILSRAERT